MKCMVSVPWGILGMIPWARSPISLAALCSHSAPLGPTTVELVVTKRGASCRNYDGVGGMRSPGIMNWDSWSWLVGLRAGGHRRNCCRYKRRRGILGDEGEGRKMVAAMWSEGSLPPPALPGSGGMDGHRMGMLDSAPVAPRVSCDGVVYVISGGLMGNLRTSPGNGVAAACGGGGAM